MAQLPSPLLGHLPPLCGPVASSSITSPSGGADDAQYTARCHPGRRPRTNPSHWLWPDCTRAWLCKGKVFVSEKKRLILAGPHQSLPWGGRKHPAAASACRRCCVGEKLTVVFLPSIPALQCVEEAHPLSATRPGHRGSGQLLRSDLGAEQLSALWVGSWYSAWQLPGDRGLTIQLLNSFPVRPVQLKCRLLGGVIWLHHRAWPVGVRQAKDMANFMDGHLEKGCATSGPGLAVTLEPASALPRVEASLCLPQYAR